MKIKTNELIGPPLDWAVKFALENGRLEPSINYWMEKYLDPTRRYLCEAYSTNWAQGGPIIEREKIELRTSGDGWWADRVFHHTENRNDWCGQGRTPLIAALRCYVAAKLGDEVEIPEELI